MALAISSVSIVPEAPTSMPATMSTVESSTKPVADAARPVNALSREITTGMSAPPIGSTNMTPNSSASTISHDRPLVLHARDDRRPEGDRGEQHGDVEDVLAGEHDRPAAEELLQLREGDQRARERDRADQRGEHGRERLVPGEETRRLVELGQRDQRRRAAADPVEQGHHLRHRGHLHRACPDDAHHGADQRADDDQRPVPDPLECSVVAIATIIPAPPTQFPCARVSARRETAARR